MPGKESDKKKTQNQTGEHLEGQAWVLENKRKCTENKSDQKWQAEALLWKVVSLEEETERQKQYCRMAKESNKQINQTKPQNHHKMDS